MPSKSALMTMTATAVKDADPSTESTVKPRSLLAWPTPALAIWSLSALIHHTALNLQWQPGVSIGLASCASLLGACWMKNRWRALFVALGFPIMMLLINITSGISAMWWLMGMLALLLIYPLKAWNDAPYFPTHEGALQSLNSVIHVQDHAKILDVGCGLGAGIRNLQAIYPLAEVHGVEWSRPLAWLCRWKCPRATIHRADMWEFSWQAFDLIYVFQRPESMELIFQKAQRELKAGSCLVSLEFEVKGIKPTAVLQTHLGKSVWIYQF